MRSQLARLSTFSRPLPLGFRHARASLATTASTIPPKPTSESRTEPGNSPSNTKSGPTTSSPAKKPKKHLVFGNRGPSLQDFLNNSSSSLNKDDSAASLDPTATRPADVPYLSVRGRQLGAGAKYFVEVYGCQMNVNDTEILMAIMNEAGYVKAEDHDTADIVFLVTCAIRENAESRIWNRLSDLKRKRLGPMKDRAPCWCFRPITICMAERLKDKLLDSDKMVDLVCGPDAYRSIPHLLSISESTRQGVANVMLSADETYADIVPVRIAPESFSAHLSIMRGCNNMCSFCVVPFTRGNERSRAVESILREVRQLSDQGIKEVTLLGQNVNSYRDLSEDGIQLSAGVGAELSNSGFKTIYKRKDGGMRFTELLDSVSLIDPEMRIRFTSPHPKDFPTALLHLMASRPNICSQIHMPAQSGSTTVLSRMRRGYSKETYLELVDTIRSIVPGVALSSDFITGFCGENEADHEDTMDLMRRVEYEMAYMFMYSRREGTHAGRRLEDDVPEAVKLRRLQDIIQIFHKGAENRFKARVNNPAGECVLVEGRSRRDSSRWIGRADGGYKIVFDDDSVLPTIEASLNPSASSNPTAGRVSIKLGDYVQVMTTSATSTSFQGKAIARTTLTEFAKYQSKFLVGNPAIGHQSVASAHSPLVSHLGLGSLNAHV
ncbi:CDK5 regulatory subunit associated protein 1 [Lunasporangiospora selenospora]|uniref:CDK5 regulatory subunit associated protein 1 n=1 Tax=Lunasporangiospora selenospora TaxID=979761 RepID=A0A9P6FW14_9FUNG|nr:CDK5 regulatory subunit associated protein 1 [Lunasporangiospora selenospora]